MGITCLFVFYFRSYSHISTDLYVCLLTCTWVNAEACLSPLLRLQSTSYMTQ